MRYIIFYNKKHRRVLKFDDKFFNDNDPDLIKIATTKEGEVKATLHVIPKKDVVDILSEREYLKWFREDEGKRIVNNLTNY